MQIKTKQTSGQPSVCLGLGGGSKAEKLFGYFGNEQPVAHIAFGTYTPPFGTYAHFCPISGHTGRCWGFLAICVCTCNWRDSM